MRFKLRICIPLTHLFINISLKTLSGREYSCNAGPTGDASSTMGWEDPLEECMATHSSILARRIPWEKRLVGYSPQGCKESAMMEHAHTQ